MSPRRARPRTIRVASTIGVPIAALGLLGMLGCEAPNPGYCGPSGPTCPIDGRAIDARLDAAIPCNGDACPQGLTCRVGVCVDCLDNDETQSADCAATRPICAADYSCRPCTLSSECNAPLQCAGGQCVTAASVAP